MTIANFTRPSTITALLDNLVVGESLFANLNTQRICHVIYFRNKFTRGNKNVGNNKHGCFYLDEWVGSCCFDFRGVIKTVIDDCCEEGKEA